MDEVDRLAEMERQRRIREAEQKVITTKYLYYISGSLSRVHGMSMC